MILLYVGDLGRPRSRTALPAVLAYVRQDDEDDDLVEAKEDGDKDAQAVKPKVMKLNMARLSDGLPPWIRRCAKLGGPEPPEKSFGHEITMLGACLTWLPLGRGLMDLRSWA